MEIEQERQRSRGLSNRHSKAVHAGSSWKEESYRGGRQGRSSFHSDPQRKLMLLAAVILPSTKFSPSKAASSIGRLAMMISHTTVSSSDALSATPCHTEMLGRLVAAMLGITWDFSCCA